MDYGGTWGQGAHVIWLGFRDGTSKLTGGGLKTFLA